jgi:hypothetical protein
VKRRTKKRDPRFTVGEQTREVGMGPLNFDVEMAKRHGWTSKQIEAAWEKLAKVYLAYSHVVTRKNPALYRKVHGDTVYVGPDANGKTLNLDGEVSA